MLSDTEIFDPFSSLETELFSVVFSEVTSAPDIGIFWFSAHDTNTVIKKIT